MQACVLVTLRAVTHLTFCAKGTRVDHFALLSIIYFMYLPTDFTQQP